MSLKKKSTTLADEISDLLTTVPKSYGSDDECEDTKAKVVDYDDEIDLNDFKREFNSLNIRKQNENLLEDYDKRYAGKKISRKEIFNEDESSEENYEEDDDSSPEENSEENINSDDEDDMSIKDSEDDSNEEQNNNNIESDNEEEEEEEEDDDDDDDDDNHDDMSVKGSENDSNEEQSNSNAKLQEDNEAQSDFEYEFNESFDRSNPLLRDRKHKSSIQTMSNFNYREELEKGNCVQEQLRIWENLLEVRIRLQKVLISSNKMPQYDVYKTYESDKEFKVQCTSVKQKLSDLLNNLLELQTNLINNFPETKDVLIKSKKRKIKEGENETNDNSMNEEIPSDTEDEIDDDKKSNVQEDSEESDTKEKKEPVRKKIKLSNFEGEIAKNHKLYIEFRNSVIQKWNDKTRIASGIINKRANLPALRQIEFLLASKDKLLKKTQLKRSEYDIIGKSPTSIEDNNGFRTQEYDSEIFDDDDFYHQLLRDLIEYKSTDLTDPIQLSKQWIQLQNMRTKMKRKIDTRATKGRRIRYNVHQKIMNFMAPITVSDTWTDLAKDELYSSLFGKIKAVTQEKVST